MFFIRSIDSGNPAQEDQKLGESYGNRDAISLQQAPY
jgi:hypothetical protein